MTDIPGQTVTGSELWVPEFDRAPIEGKPGVASPGTEPKHLRVHLANGTVSAVMEAYASHPPHAIVDFRTGERIQHIPLNRKAYLLDDPEGESATPGLQIEVVGRTDDARRWPEPMVAWLAYEVFAPIRALALTEEAAAIPPATAFAQALQTLSAAGHDLTDDYLGLRGRITAAAKIAAERRSQNT